MQNQAKPTYLGLWCPMSRISIQREEGRAVRAVETGAFNIVAYTAQNGVETVKRSARCQGPTCPLYRRGFSRIGIGWGRCTLSGPSIVPQFIGYAAALLFVMYVVLSNY